MTPEEYAEYWRFVADNQGPMITAREVGTDPRVLCEGYTVERDAFVVEMIASEFEVRINDVLVRRGKVMHPDELRPNKRAHPERTDLRFAKVMAARGEPLTFTSWRKGSPLFGEGRS